jgi:hypothetical protein
MCSQNVALYMTFKSITYWIFTLPHSFNQQKYKKLSIGFRVDFILVLDRQKVNCCCKSHQLNIFVREKEKNISSHHKHTY